MLRAMARLALWTLAVLAAGCPSGGGGDDDYPIGGGGGGGGTSGPRIDAGGGGGGDGGTGGTLISGRVCLLSDLRRLINAMTGDCAATGAAGLQVSLGGSMPVLTAADGSFKIPAREGTNLAWQVSGVGLTTSIIPVSTSALLPVIRDTAYLDLLNSNSAIVDQGEGSIIARIIRNGAVVMNATAQVVGGESLQTLYDSTNATVWGTVATGMLGVAWLPDNVAGTRTLRIVQGTTQLQVPVTIVDQAITFVTIALP